MGETQKALYDAVIVETRANRGKARGKTAEVDAGRNPVKFTNQRSLYARMRRACNHPCLLRNHYDADAVAQIAKAALKAQHFGDRATMKQIERELEEYSDYQLHSICTEVPSLRDLRLLPSTLQESAKFQFLQKMLPDLRQGGHKVLIFSQFVHMLNLLEELLGPDGLNLPFVRLDGDTPVTERQSLIDQYQDPDSDIFAFLLSTRAGGQGISLTAADTVIMHDLDWNPSLDKQAEDRAHRIGQKRDVHVYRLITAGSIEEAILRLQQRKKVLGDSVLDARCDAVGAAALGDKSNRDGLSNEATEGLGDDAQEAADSKLDSSVMSAVLEYALGLNEPVANGGAESNARTMPRGESATGVGPTTTT